MAHTVFDLVIPADVHVEGDPLAFCAAAFATDHVTLCGWPYALAETPDGSFLARYRFLDHEAIVRARGPRAAVLSVLATARPDWKTDEVIALSQLWSI